MLATSSACFQSHSAGTGTVRCAISGQMAQQQEPYGALSGDTAAGTVRCAISGQMTEQQAPYGVLSVNSRHSSRHCGAERLASHGNAAGPAASEGRLRRRWLRPHGNHPIQPGLPVPTRPGQCGTACRKGWSGDVGGGSRIRIRYACKGRT